MLKYAANKNDFLEKVTLDDMLDLMMRELRNLKPYSCDHCPKYIHSRMFESREIALELIDFRDSLKVGYTGEYDSLMHFLQGYSTLEMKIEHTCVRLTFKDIVAKLLDKNPECMYIQGLRLLLKKNETMEDKITKIANRTARLERVEQYQAQILDKLTVFAEMIDDIQKKLDKTT